MLLSFFDPQKILIGTCVVVFMATSAITLLGIINKININSIYLNRLFYALILEIAAIGVWVFRSYFIPPADTQSEFVKIVSPEKEFHWGNFRSIIVDGAFVKTTDEVLKAELMAKNKIWIMSNEAKSNNAFFTNIDTALLDNKSSSIFTLSVYKGNKKILSDSLILIK